MTMALEIGLGTFFNPPAPLASKSKVIISAIKSIEPYGKEIETKMVCVQVHTDQAASHMDTKRGCS